MKKHLLKRKVIVQEELRNLQEAEEGISVVAGEDLPPKDEADLGRLMWTHTLYS